MKTIADKYVEAEKKEDLFKDYISKSNNSTQESGLQKNDIENKAKQLLIAYGLYKVPVDVFSLVKKMGIDIRTAEFSNDNIAGTILKKNKDLKIIVNKNDFIERQRFTIAHELGHYFLHFENKSNSMYVEMYRSEVKNTEETEANYFASALLMDEDLIKREFKKVIKMKFPETATIAIMANLFKVSLTAMTYRLGNLGLVNNYE
jgi:Zn-dependent peptidase ImmA (M78 family)